MLGPPASDRQLSTGQSNCEAPRESAITHKMKTQAPLNAAERVYRAIRGDLIACRFLPGDALSRASLAKDHDTSQTPVREALLRLEREGFLTVKPQAGTKVAPIDPVAVHQAHFLRRSLEESVVRRLAARNSAHGVSDPICRLAPDAARPDIARADEAFHESLFAAVGMAALFEAVAPLLVPLERCAALRQVTSDEVASAARAHADILDRITQGDPDGAAQAMAAHLASDVADLAALQDSRPDMFAT